MKLIKKIASRLFAGRKLLLEMRDSIDKIQSDVACMKWKQELLADYSYDICKCEKAKGHLRDFQLQVVRLLNVFKEVCNNLDIQYWMCFGSCLGAFRHKGFIPWDDDCDVGLLKCEFDRLRACSNEFVKHGMKLIDWWVPGKMARVIFENLEGPFIDVIAFCDNGAYVTAMPPWGKAVRYCLPCPKDFILPVAKNACEFEGVAVNMPVKVDEYLRFYYGDYMLFPKKFHSETGHFQIDPHSTVFKM